MPMPIRETASLLVPRSLVEPLMRLYDYPHPGKPGRVIRGYDRPHALRTARMCAAVARRLGYARRLARQLRAARPKLARLGVQWALWMERVMLYYYYPEKLDGSARWVRELAEVLVACEQLEAYSNRQRGHDYYARKKESLPEAFAYLGKLQVE